MNRPKGRERIESREQSQEQGGHEAKRVELCHSLGGLTM